MSVEDVICCSGVLVRLEAMQVDSNAIYAVTYLNGWHEMLKKQTDLPSINESSTPSELLMCMSFNSSHGCFLDCDCTLSLN
jgi:hypothetical protein